jgi:hypothetical protein
MASRVIDAMTRTENSVLSVETKHRRVVSQASQRGTGSTEDIHVEINEPSILVIGLRFPPMGRQE